MWTRGCGPSDAEMRSRDADAEMLMRRRGDAEKRRCRCEFLGAEMRMRSCGCGEANVEMRMRMRTADRKGGIVSMRAATSASTGNQAAKEPRTRVRPISLHSNDPKRLSKGDCKFG